VDGLRCFDAADTATELSWTGPDVLDRGLSPLLPAFLSLPGSCVCTNMHEYTSICVYVHVRT
jgi:hypothetical protein